MYKIKYYTKYIILLLTFVNLIFLIFLYPISLINDFYALCTMLPAIMLHVIIKYHLSPLTLTMYNHYVILISGIITS